MRILLDTNVLSEPTRPNPTSRVVVWLNALDESETFVSVVTLAEIHRGILRLDAGRRRTNLARWFHDGLLERFAGRILPIDEASALAWGDLMASTARRGRTLGTMDAFIAATASSRALALATRNVVDFNDLGLQIVDPWSA